MMARSKLYLCAIKDVYSNRIVGYSIDSRMKSRLAVAALTNAVARRGDVAGCVLHTARGRQRGHGILLLVAAEEGTQPALLGDALRISIVRWIETTYHRRRRQAVLGRLTPVEHELIMSPTATQAA